MNEDLDNNNKGLDDDNNDKETWWTTRPAVAGSSHLVHHVFMFILVELHRVLLSVPPETCGHTCMGSGTLGELYVHLPGSDFCSY